MGGVVAASVVLAVPWGVRLCRQLALGVLAHGRGVLALRQRGLTAPERLRRTPPFVVNIVPGFSAEMCCFKQYPRDLSDRTDPPVRPVRSVQCD